MEIIFKKPGLGMRAAFEGLARQVGTQSCQYAFAAVYCLQEKYGTELCMTDDAAFLRSLSRTPGRVDYFAPLCAAERFADALAALERFAQADGRPYEFFGLTGAQASVLEAQAPGRYRMTADRDWAEYLYDSQPLATLEGAGLKQKRKEARQCWKTLGDRLTIEPLCAAHADEVLAFQRTWMAAHDAAGEDASLAGEDRAIAVALEHFDALGLSGIVARIDGAVAGYSYGCPVGCDTYDILVQKASAQRFLYRVVFQECVCRCAQGFRYVNAEEDIGIPGLRALKLSYHPALLLEKYRAEVMDG